MAGLVAELRTTVAKGEILVLLDAMKVQMRLTAPLDGIVDSVRAQPGDLVDDGVELVIVAAP